MLCENCGTKEGVEHYPEFGDLCEACYLVLSQAHFDIIDEGGLE